MNIYGITVIRNEGFIVEDTLKNWRHVCPRGIFILDAASEDNTVAVCREQSIVTKIIRNQEWSKDRARANWELRQRVLREAQKEIPHDAWLVYFDADERLHRFNPDFFRPTQATFNAVACKLYDVYITPQDKDLDYRNRGWVGPEYRTIKFFFKNDPRLSYSQAYQREVTLPSNSKVAVSGIVKHYRKGISVKHWEETCDYYINHCPRFSEKWKKRKGKAVKEDYKSDFGNPLISFEAVLRGEEIGIPLERQPYGKN